MRFLLALMMMFFVAGPALAAPVVGQPAPDFTFKDTGGNEGKLSNYKGQVVVLEWTNHECPYVKKHYDSNNMQTLQAQAAEQKVVWLRINSGAPGKQGHVTPQDADRLAAEKGVKSTATILDETGEIGKLYAARTTPHMFVIDKDGALAYSGAIDDKPTSDADDIATSKNYVKTVLDDIHAGRPVTVAETQPYGCGVKYAD